MALHVKRQELLIVQFVAADFLATTTRGMPRGRDRYARFEPRAGDEVCHLRNLSADFRNQRAAWFSVRAGGKQCADRVRHPAHKQRGGRLEISDIRHERRARAREHRVDSRR